ncbi:hypothetical protein WDW86_01420 [Bdellovibrionota bacterium FG-2]
MAVYRKMSDLRRSHPLTVLFNDRRFLRVEIDPHYETKHPEMTDQIVLELIKQLDGKTSPAVDEDNGFKFFVEHPSFQGKLYRIILTYSEEEFLGVVNAFRVKEKKV